MSPAKRDPIFSKISLKSKLWIAFVFVTFAPGMIIFQYLTNLYSLSPFTIGVLLAATFLGWWFVIDAFSGVMRVYRKTEETLKKIEEKEAPRHDDVRDEVDKLDVIFNVLSSKVKESVEELKKVSQKTEELNRQINQKVSIFSTILQAHIMFSRGVAAGDIFQFFVDRLAAVLEAKSVVAFLPELDSREGASHACFSTGTKDVDWGEFMNSDEFSSLFQIRESTFCSPEEKRCPRLSEFLGTGRFLINPMYRKDDVVGIVVVGFSEEEVSLRQEVKEIVELFSRNMSIVWEHERLARKIEDLEMVDPLTGILNEKFFFMRLEEEIKRAVTYQRPCGLLVVEIANYSQYEKEAGLIETERFLKKLVKIIKDKVSPIDILGRIEENKIGVILIEHSRRQCVEVKDSIGKEVDLITQDDKFKPLISFAIAENPVDGTDAQTLYKCIKSQLSDR